MAVSLVLGGCAGNGSKASTQVFGDFGQVKQALTPESGSHISLAPSGLFSQLFSRSIWANMMCGEPVLVAGVVEAAKVRKNGVSRDRSRKTQVFQAFNYTCLWAFWTSLQRGRLLS